MIYNEFLDFQVSFNLNYNISVLQNQKFVPLYQSLNHFYILSRSAIELMLLKVPGVQQRLMMKAITLEVREIGDIVSQNVSLKILVRMQTTEFYSTHAKSVLF